MIEIQAENKSVKNKPYKRHHVWCDDELSSQDIEITKKNHKVLHWCLINSYSLCKNAVDFHFIIKF